MSTTTERPPKPEAMPVTADAIPGELKAVPQWVGWKWEWNGKKWTKPPFSIHTGRKCDKTSKSSWCSFRQALDAQQAGIFDGIGFCFTPNDPYAGIDLDDCRDPDSGGLTTDAKYIIGRAGSYAEVSPSSMGVKIFVRAKLPADTKHADHERGFEVYDAGSYFCVTGHHVEDTPSTIRDCQAEIGDITRFMFGQQGNLVGVFTPSVAPDDRELALDALRGLSTSRAGGYHDWLKVGMALHATDSTLCSAWDGWSQSAADKYQAGACAEKWQSFGSGSKAVGLGSLIHWAQADGWKAPWERNGKTSGNGQATAANNQNTTTEQHPIEFRRISCAELDAATYDLEYLIDGALVAGQPCILAGGKKCLKTSLLIDLGISLAMGGCFLGKLRANRACRVGIMTGESGLATIQETARRICRAAGYQLADIGGLVWSEQLPQFGSVAHQEALRRFITDDELEVLAVDPAYMCIPDVDHANLFEIGTRLQGVSQVCQDTGAMLLLAHHTRKTKTDPYSPPELEDISWAGFQEFARQWLLVGRREPYEPGTGQHRLWLSAGGSAGHSDLWAVDISEGTRATPGGRYWNVNVMRASDARQDVQDRKEAEKAAEWQEKLESDKRRVVNAMAKFPEGETAKVIRSRAGVSGERFNVIISSLLEDDAVIETGVIKPNRTTPYDGYKLAGESSPDGSYGTNGTEHRDNRCPDGDHRNGTALL